MSVDSVAASVEEVQGLLRERLRVDGPSLERQIAKAGRLLPRAVAVDARFLAQASFLVQNPKLARMIDPARIASARARVVEHLRAVDPAERRKDRILGVAGTVAFNFLVFGGALIAFLVWRGFV